MAIHTRTHGLAAVVLFGLSAPSAFAQTNATVQPFSQAEKDQGAQAHTQILAEIGRAHV